MNEQVSAAIQSLGENGLEAFHSWITYKYVENFTCAIVIGGLLGLLIYRIASRD